MIRHHARSPWFEDGYPLTPPDLSKPDETVKLVSNWSTFPREAVAAGLSPNCKTAFLATTNRVRLYAIDLDTVGNSTLRAEIPSRHIEDVALTNDTIAVLTKSTTELYVFDLRKPDGQRTTTLLSHGYRNGDGSWLPLCIALCDVSGIKSLALAGYGVSGLVEVRIFRIQLNDGRLSQPHHTYRNDAVDAAKKVTFCPKGRAVAVVTAGNRVLVWHIRNGLRPAMSINAQESASKDTHDKGLTLTCSVAEWPWYEFRNYISVSIFGKELCIQHCGEGTR
jgi:hypothetical protein